jgi:hypothetical protein
MADCHHARWKPSLVIVSCGDANGRLTLRYVSWTHEKAVANGSAYFNHGGLAGKAFAARVVLSKPRRCGRHLLFSRVHVRYPGSSLRDFRSTLPPYIFDKHCTFG